MAVRKRAKHTARRGGAARTKKAKRVGGARPAGQVSGARKQRKPEPVKRVKTNVSIPEQDLARRTIENIVANEMAVEYLKKNVSKRAVDVVNLLAAPKTDEGLAEQLGMKINAIRRILNIMHGYGITNYYVSKNTNGWLSFSWYINANKVQPFLDYISSMETEKSAVDENSNDYFICNSCYKSDKFVYTFDAAFEASFKCNSCKSSLARLDRGEVETLLSARSEV